LLGLAGAADMRAIVERRETDDAARLALAVYTHSLRRWIGAMTASLGGIDALVFTGGVGERSAVVREAACDGLAYLGIVLDPELNRHAEGDGDLHRKDGDVRIRLVQAREDLEIARQVNAAL
jgi:acetate kinase